MTAAPRICIAPDCERECKPTERTCERCRKRKSDANRRELRDRYTQERPTQDDLDRRRPRALVEAREQARDWSDDHKDIADLLSLGSLRDDTNLPDCDSDAFKASRDASRNGAAGHLDRVARARAIAEAKTSSEFLSAARRGKAFAAARKARNR